MDCDFCKKVFGSKTALEHHKKTAKYCLEIQGTSPQIFECVYCKKHLSDDSIKTVVHHNDESRIIKFCSFKCFENKDDWQKYKIKKIGKKKNIKPNKNSPPKETKKTLSNKELKNLLSKKWDENKSSILESYNSMLPLVTKEELKDIAKENNIKIPTIINNKKDIAKHIFKELNLKSKQTILTEKQDWIKKRMKEIKKEQYKLNEEDKNKKTSPETKNDKALQK